jgi:hypothetical protein
MYNLVPTLLTYDSREGQLNAMKKIMILAFLALSLFAKGTTNKNGNPLPTCDPCPWVR